MVSPSVRKRRTGMEEILAFLLTWHQNEKGQDLVEYGLLASFISIAAIAGIALVGPYLQTMFNYVVSMLNLT